VKITIERGDWEKLKRLIRSRLYTAKADTKIANNINVYFQQGSVMNCIEFTQGGLKKSQIPLQGGQSNKVVTDKGEQHGQTEKE
jgi:hypothetical protein